MRRRYSAVIMSIVIAISMSLNVIPVFAADAEGTLVSTFEDLQAMENNPTGIYYLTADIAAKPNTILFADDGMPFKGTVNGNRHKITGYSYSASTKVSAVTSAKCKALKSSKWIYSKKYKSLILKNNKEAQKQM